MRQQLSINLLFESGFQFSLSEQRESQTKNSNNFRAIFASDKYMSSVEIIKAIKKIAFLLFIDHNSRVNAQLEVGAKYIFMLEHRLICR